MTRRLLAPLAVAARRIAARPGSVLLTGLGIALASAALTTLLVGQVIVEDRAVSDAIGRLPADERMVSVSWVGLGDQVRNGDRSASGRRRCERASGASVGTTALALRSGAL